MLQPSDNNRVYGRRDALCVGIGTYTYVSNHNLRYAVDDATTIAERLADPGRGNFAVTTLTEPSQTTKEAIDTAVKTLLSAPNRQAEDLTLLYISCHGDVNKEDNTFCLLPSDVTLQPDGVYEQKTMINISDLARWFASAKTHHIIVLLDVCHSGGAGVALQHFKLNLDAGPNFFIIGAARQDQTTTENSALRHGIFTHCLLRAFEQPPTKDGWLTVTQIQNFVSDDISWFAKGQPTQIQVSSVFVDPYLPLVRNPGYPELCPLPPLWNVRLRRNPFFTGQEELLSQVASTLQSKQKTALTQPHALNGLGGIGKTQLALEYAYRHRQDYHAILWGRADTREALFSTFSDLALMLDLPEKDEKDQMVIVNAVKQWLKDRSQWLFILDNADELELVKDFIPPAFRGDLLLTTRAQAMGEVAQNIEVKLMQPESSALLLLRRSGLIARDALLEVASPSDVALATEITQENLGGLPLAIDQAGAYMNETGYSLSAYQNLYHIHEKELLNERGNLVGDHPEPVTTTWSLSFQKVKERNLAAADLLQFCAYLAPDAIPEEIIVSGAEHLGPALQLVASDPFAFNQAIVALRAYSLIRRNGEERTLSIHRLVQAVLQETVEKEARSLWRERAMLAVNATFPHVEHQTWPQCERMLSQALFVAQSIKPDQLRAEEAGRLCYETAVYLWERARYGEAEPLYQRALHIREQLLGPEHTSVAYPLNALANLYSYQGKYAQAESLYQRALHIWEQQLGPEHRLVAISFNNLAELYSKQGKYEEAEPLWKGALHIFEQQLGLEHDLVATSLNNLAELYREQGKYAQAEPLYQRALHIWEQELGPEHPDVAYALNNLAALYTQQGKYAQAEPLYQRALHIREQSLGPDHPQVAYLLNNLAEHYCEQGKYAQVEPLYQRALHIREQSLGPEHPQVAYSLNGLASLYREQGKYTQAEPLYQRALHIYEQQLGPEYTYVAYSLHGLANLYREQSKYAQAEPLYQRALHIRKKHSGEAHPETAQIIHDFARFWETQGNSEDARAWYARALAARELALGKYHPKTTETRARLIALLHSMGQHEEAAKLEEIQSET